MSLEDCIAASVMLQGNVNIYTLLNMFVELFTSELKKNNRWLPEYNRHFLREIGE